MAKGRTLITSRSELFLRSFEYGHIHHAGATDGPPELREDEVWSIVDETSTGEWDSHSRGGGDGRGGRTHPPPPPRADRHRRRQVGGLSIAFDQSDDSPTPRIVHQFRAAAESPRGPRSVAASAPVNIPDWSKIHRVDSVESVHDSDEGLTDESELVPPHEYLARSRKMEANSVFEGVGRKLKGRDLSRVRDAVWSQTGFYG